MSLSSFPPELLFLICEYAWTSEHGARDLSLVSKLFRDITAPLHYRCVSRPITSIPKDLPAFHRVRHLFVSHAPSSATVWMDALKDVADTLETLCVDLPQTHLISCVFRVRFPRLRELMVNGFYPFPGRMDMPRLRRLHLAGHRNPQGLLEQCAGMWGGLEGLRISGVTGACMFAREVEDVILRREEEGEDGMMGSLKLLMIQLGPEIPTKKRADEQMLEVLRSVAQQKREGGPSVVIVEDRLEGSKLDSKQAMTMWRDGVDGFDKWWQ